MLHIPFTFLLPIFLMVGGTCIPTIMSVPEATIHKHSDLFLGKYKIGMSLYLIVSSPACDSVMLEYFNQTQFSGLILFGLDLSHDVGPFFRIENIRHYKSPGFKLYAETGICFCLQHNFVVSFDYSGESRVSPCLVEKAMLINVSR